MTHPDTARRYDRLEFEIWLQNGIARNWVSEVFCLIHAEPPASDTELDDLEEYGETCMRSVRIWI